MEFIFVFFLLFLYNFYFPSRFFCLFFFLCLVFFPMFTPDQQSTALPPMLVRLFSIPGVTTLFRDPWGGLSLVPLITVLFRFVLLILWII